MAIYAIGDLQGCLEPLERLLERIAFDPAGDRLWFVGDLVNRGPDSVGCLRLVKSLGPAAVAVLGNHDLHLLCVAEGIHGQRRRDTLDGVLSAPDRDELLDWLRHRPLMHVEGAFAMVHAGLLPEWSVEKARGLAGEVEVALRGREWRRFLSVLFGNEPERWSDSLEGYDRLRPIVNALTRLRVCRRDGSMDMSFRGEPGERHDKRIPWFEIPRRDTGAHTLVCGHWSVIGLRLEERLITLDTGCVWGNPLTAVRLSDRRVFQSK
jgi:bis(5'-nucleosyl)-tetraphosphatase (symmetrical)